MRSRDVMRGEMERRMIYGSEAFAGRLKKAYEMVEMIKPIGRPKKEGKQNVLPYTETCAITIA